MVKKVKGDKKMKNKLLFNNTYSSGTVSYLVTKEKNRYVGVCLEFDLFVEAESIKEAKEYIEDTAEAWLENIIKNKLSEELLNKPAPKKYWVIFKKGLEASLLRLKAEQDSSAISHNINPSTISCVTGYKPGFFPLGFA